MNDKMVWVDLKRAERRYRFSLPLNTVGVIVTADRLDALGWMLIQQLADHCTQMSASQEPGEVAIRAVASHLQVHYDSDVDFFALAKAHGLSRRSFFRN